MYLSLLAVMGATLVTNLGLTRSIFSAAYHWQEQQIRADNAAIRWGRSQREIFNSVARANHWIRGAELAHHPWHACARVPKTAAVCVPVDRAWEARIEAYVRATLHYAVTRWRLAVVQVRTELGGTWAAAGGDLRARWEVVSCPLCGVSREVRWNGVAPATHVHVFGSTVDGVGIQLVPKRGDWSYRLSSEDAIRD